MIKRFKYRKLNVRVKTNQTNAGIAYFGEKDIQAEVENTYKKVEYTNGHSCPEDVFVVEIYKLLKEKGISAHEVELGNSAYRGVKLTDIKEQTKLNTKE